MIRKNRRIIPQRTLSQDVLERLANQTAMTFGNYQVGGEMYIGLHNVTPRDHFSDLAFAGAIIELGRGFAKMQGCSIYAPHGILLIDDVSPAEIEINCNEQGVSVNDKGCQYSGFLFPNMEKFCVGLRELGYTLPDFFGDSVRRALEDLRKSY